MTAEKRVPTHKVWVLRDRRAKVSICRERLFKDVTLLTVDKRSHVSRDVLPGALDPRRV